MLLIKNVRITSHEDNFSDAYSVEHITVPYEFKDKVIKAVNVVSDNFSDDDYATITLLATDCQSSNPFHKILSVSVTRDGMSFEIEDETTRGLATTEDIPVYETFSSERFLLQDGGDGIYQWNEGLDDDVFDPMDFTLVIANSIEEAIEHFKLIS